MKNKLKMLKSLVFEYGPIWVFNRIIYILKIKLMRKNKNFWKFFEKKVDVKDIDIFDINVKELEKFLCNIENEKKEEIIKKADDAIKGRLEAFNAKKLNYLYPIKWNYNPITKQEVSLNKRWYEIEDFNEKIGDIKIIWEPSRFCYFYLFSRAYIITKNIKYYEAFSENIQSWVNQNIYPYGPNYKCGQEATIRMINLLLNYTVFNKYNLITKKDKENIFKIVKYSYKKVQSNFFYAHKCIKNNHTLSEIIGLIIGAQCCMEKGKIKKAYKLLFKEIKNQVLDDGGYIQYSFNYHRLALQLFEIMFKLEEVTKVNTPNEIKELIYKSAMLLYQVQVENGDVPNYGSNDGALIFPVTLASYRDFSPPINTLYTYIKDNKLYKDKIYDEELIWLGKKEALYYKYEKVKRVSVKFDKIGLYTLRNKELYAMIVCNSYKHRPAHMDGLHLDLWYNDHNIFCDSGTYSYADEQGKKLVLTDAHNTIKVDSVEQMSKFREFFIYNYTKSKVIKYSNGEIECILRSKNGYIHTRRIKIEDSKMKVKEIITTNRNRKYVDVLFHTPYDTNIINNNKIEMKDNEGRKYEITLKDKDIKPIIEKSFLSLFYYIKEEISVIKLRKNIKNRKKVEINYEMMVKL